MFRLIVLSALIVSALGASITGPSERIIGGTVITDIREAPYVVSIRLQGTHICGGAIITTQHVITSAECVKGLHVDDITVHAHSTNFFQQTTFQAYRMEINPHYNTVTRDFNVALLKVRTKFDVLDHAVIEDEPNPAINWPMQTFGWGATEDSSSTLSGTLVRSDMAVIDRSTCNTMNYHVTENMVCTSSENKGMCKGDFGGPLVDAAFGYPRLLGVSIQSSSYCGNKAYPNVFFTLASVRPWIKSLVGV